MSVGRRVVLGLALCGLLPTACEDEPVPVAQTAPPEDKAAFVAKAHQQALTDALPVVESALTMADPIAGHAARGTALRPTPIRAARLAEVDAAIEGAAKALAEIDARHLLPPQAVILQVGRFGIDRARDRSARSRPWRTDPEWVVLETTRLLDAIERQLRTENHDDALAALVALPPELASARETLVGSAPAVATAASEDWRALAKRLDALSIPSGSSGWDEARSEAQKEMLALADVLAAPLAAGAKDKQANTAKKQGKKRKGGKKSGKRGAKAAQKHEPSGAPEAELVLERERGAALARLPDRLTPEQLRRRLEVEEHLVAGVEKLFNDVGHTLDRLDMLGYRTPSIERTPATPVDEARCVAAWAPIHAWIRRQPALSEAGLDCAEVMPRLAAMGKLDDVDLTRALVRLGVVEPTERARRSAELPVLALVQGFIAPYSHPIALSIAVLTGMRDPALRREVGDAREQLCLAATALWVHGGLGTDAALAERLRDRCPNAEPSEWIGQALARPRASLAGLGLIELGAGPADVVALEQYWWAPLGLLQTLAHPDDGRAADRPPPGKIEPL